MHQIIEAITAGCRDHGLVESDRATARLGLLVVLDHLDRALDHDELEELAAAMPAGLAVMLQRRRGYDRPSLELVSPELIAIVCEVLAGHPIDAALGRKLREEVAGRLLERGARPRSRHARTTDDRDDRPTLRVVSQLRPTVVVARQEARRTA